MIFIIAEYQNFCPLVIPLLFFVIYHSEKEPAPIDVVVENSLQGTTPVTFSTYVVYRGILLGALRRLMDSNANFK